MKITDIRIKKFDNAGKMKAIATIIFDDCFIINDIKVIQNEDKLFVAMPSRKTPDGQYRDIAHPINAGMRAELEEEILKEYRKPF